MPRTLVALALLTAAAADCQQSYKIYTDPPRLWLDARRLRLLRRERDRDSVRWKQLQLNLKSGEPLPEEPLARALLFQVANDETSGKQALDWALKRAELTEPPDAAELRLLAVALDWCYALASEPTRNRIAARIARGVEAMGNQPGWTPFTSAVLASIAAADDWPGSEAALAGLLDKRWPKEFEARLKEGEGVDTPADRVAVLELCHAVRQNLNLDLWTRAPVFFRQFPILLLLQYYPPPVTIDDHRFRQPALPVSAKGDPAALGEQSRIAELLTSAYETNSVETQFLQGWITHDIYRLRSPYAAVYEYLWMNPYQPGLSYYAAPLYLYDELGGTLWARSSWDDDAVWIGYFGGQLQLFADGERSLVEPTPPAAPIVFPHLAVARASGDTAFRARLTEGGDIFVVGLEAGRTYWVKLDGKKFVPMAAAKGGVLHLEAQAGTEAEVEIRAADPNPPAPSLERKKK